MGWSDGSAMSSNDLRRWMKHYGFSNTMLATHLGVGLSTVKRWKRRGAPQARLLELALDGLLYESGRLP